jgi:hypothetical protein
MKNESKQVVRRLAVLDKNFRFKINYVLKAGHALRLSSLSIPIVRLEKTGELYIDLGKGISGHVPAGDFHLEEEVETHTVTIVRRRLNDDELS